MGADYRDKIFSTLVLTISACIIIATDFNGLAALIYILPMILETVKETDSEKESKFELIVDYIGLVLSSILLVLITLYMVNIPINEWVIRIGLFVYPFYEFTYAVMSRIKKKMEV